MRPTLLLAFFLIAASSPGQGAPVDVRVIVPGESSAIDIRELRIQIVGGPAGHETEKLLPLQSRSIRLDLETRGVWYLKAVAPGYWGEIRPVITPHEGEQIDLPLWPAATLRGRLPSSTSVTEVTIRFQSAAIDQEGAAGVPALPAGSERCTIANEILQCPVPAGRIDSSLRSAGFVPIHHWNRTYAAGEVVDLGKLEFKKGSSLQGRVTTPRDWRIDKDHPIRIQLVPEMPPSNRPGETLRSAIGASYAIANDRGFFLFEGVRPGAYEISASAPRLVSERVTVTVLDGLQAELRKPLALSRPLTIAMAIDPPVDPWGKTWTVELARVDLRSRDLQLLETAKASEGGTWSRTGIMPGDYLVKVRRMPRGVWHSELVSVGEDRTVAITIPLAKVAGELRLADMPLAGTIWFGGELGEVSIPIRTRPDGRFQAFLPVLEGNIWKEVDVAANTPHVRTTLTDVRLNGPDDEGIWTVKLILPANRLFGEVVTEEGKPVASNATVFAAIRGDDLAPFQVDVDDAGVFSFTGLQPGTYSVYAAGADGKSVATDVTVDDTATNEMKIVLRRDKSLRGSVQSRHGAVAGARVSAYPEDRTGFGIVQWDQTDLDGRFSVAVTPDAQNVTLTVLAPGYAYTLLAIPAIPAEPLAIPVEQDGGRIVAELQPYEPPRQAYLFHGRAFVAFGALEHAYVAARDGATYVLENLAPGQYEVCVATPAEAKLLASASSRARGRCAAGFVARGSTLALRDPARSDATAAH